MEAYGSDRSIVGNKLCRCTIDKGPSRLPISIPLVSLPEAAQLDAELHLDDNLTIADWDGRFTWTPTGTVHAVQHDLQRIGGTTETSLRILVRHVTCEDIVTIRALRNR